MKGIFRIEEYVKETEQIAVRFCRLHSHKKIEEYSPIYYSLDSLDTYSLDCFIESLMMKAAAQIEKQDKSGLIINDTEIAEGTLDVESLVGRNIEAEIGTYKKGPIKMRRVEL